MTPPVPDGPDTELAAIVADLDDLHTEAASVAMRSEGSVTAAAEEVRDDVASIRDRLRAVLARPAAGRDLTAQDVQRAYDGTIRWEPIANYLNGIARPAVARTDGQPPADDTAAPDGPTADEAVASAARIVEAWAHLRMDTPEDQATHDELVRVSRATIAAYVRTRPWSSAGQPVRDSQDGEA